MLIDGSQEAPVDPEWQHCLPVPGKKKPKHSQVNGINVPSEFNLLLYELRGRGRGINPVCSAKFPWFRGIGASKLVPRKLLMSSFCFTAHFASWAQQMSHTPVSKTSLKWGLVQWWGGGGVFWGGKTNQGSKLQLIVSIQWLLMTLFTDLKRGVSTRHTGPFFDL